MPQQKLNTIEAAEFLGVQPNTLEVWRCYKKGPKYSKVGRRVMYDIYELEKFFNNNSVHTTDSIRHEKQYRGEK